MNKKYPIYTVMVLLMIVLCEPNTILAQGSGFETWKGVQVMQVTKDDFIGVPGEMTISLARKGEIWEGSIGGSGIFYGAVLQNINYQTKKFTANVQFQFAGKTSLAEIRLLRDNNWMYGIIKLGTTVGYADYTRVYIKRE